MESLYLLIPLSLALVAFSAWLLHWSVKSGQYDDVNGPGQAILMDDDAPASTSEAAKEVPKPQK